MHYIIYALYNALFMFSSSIVYCKFHYLTNGRGSTARVKRSGEMDGSLLQGLLCACVSGAITGVVIAAERLRDW